MCAVGLHFVVGVALAFVVVYSDEWLIDCYVVACGIPSVSIAIYGFLILDILLFLRRLGAVVHFSGPRARAGGAYARRWPASSSPALTAAIALYWVLAGGSLMSAVRPRLIGCRGRCFRAMIL